MSTVAHPVGVGTRRSSKSVTRVLPLQGPVARPARKPAPGRVGTVAACSAVGTRARSAREWVLGLKVAAVALVALAGTVVSFAELASWAQSEPPAEYVAAHPAWEQVLGD